jgi:hypothetical protein
MTLYYNTLRKGIRRLLLITLNALSSAPLLI